MDLQHRVALVTGAARRVGQAIALELARGGADVVVHYGGSESAARTTAAEIAVLGVRAVPVQADLALPEAIAELIATIGRELGRLDILVNSAATFTKQPFDEITAADWDEVMAVNLRAPFLLMQHAARLMRSSERRAGESALIVNIADLSAVQIWRGFAHHSVSKSGLLWLSQVAARELAPAIRVNAIVPGAILPPPGVSPDSEEWRQFGAGLPLQRVGHPAQIGQTVRFVAENEFVTGAVIHVDGGEHLVGTRRH
jgi:pteridine reductase